MNKSEHRFQNKLLLALSKVQGAIAWRNVVGTFHPYHHPELVVKVGTEGQADVFCLLKGRFLSVELKARGGRKRKEQIAWEASVKRAGGAACFARLGGSSDADVEAAVKKTMAWVLKEAGLGAEAPRP